MMRGLGDPLAAAYARCYLARRGAALLPGDKGYLSSSLADTLPHYTAALSGDGARARAAPDLPV